MHSIPGWAAWHGRLMVLAWVVLLPLGVLVARFYKVTSRQRWPYELDNTLWWRLHLRLQYTGVGLMTVAVWIVFEHATQGSNLAIWHGRLGWIAVSLGWLQIAGGWLRGSKGGPMGGPGGTAHAEVRGDHFDMTPRRILFERAHKSLGYVALLAATGAVVMGLVLVEAPTWMRVLIAAAWLFGGVCFAVLQRRGRCVDTYQAIWGAESAYPGNRREPIGLGIRRLELDHLTRRKTP